MMTRKDYISTAEILNGALNSDYESKEALIEIMTSQFISMFVKDNQNFNRDIFLKAVSK